MAFLLVGFIHFWAPGVVAQGLKHRSERSWCNGNELGRHADAGGSIPQQRNACSLSFREPDGKIKGNRLAQEPRSNGLEQAYARNAKPLNTNLKDQGSNSSSNNNGAD